MTSRLMSIENWETLARQAAFQPAVMAARCSISLRQMQRCFAARFGKSPREWTRELRCRLACPLVLQGWSNRAVAIELGYADESHFCHEFKRFYGVSPQKFARLQAVAPPPMSLSLTVVERAVPPPTAAARPSVALRQ